MQKKLIALAIAAASGAAFAQTNVTVYGIADAGVGFYGDRLDGASDRAQSFRVHSGGQSTSRLGFKGSEDLGNGLKANFVMETGIALDTGANESGNGKAWGRKTLVGLSGGFGSVDIGRTDTPEATILTAVDPFSGGTVGQAKQLVKQVDRLNNVVVYTSPNMNGLTGYVAFASQGGDYIGAQANEHNGTNGTTAVEKSFGRTWALAGTYSNGPIFLGLNYHKANLDTVAADASVKTLTLGGTYDLGMAKIHALYDRDVYKNEGADDARQKSFVLGVSAPVGANGKVKASYVRTKWNMEEGKARQWALGYDHNLSKRTNVYVAYGDINNDDNVAYTVGTSAAGGNGVFQNGLMAGVRHQF